MTDLHKEFQYYLDNQDELVAAHNGKVLVLVDDDVIGVYDSELDALLSTEKEHKLGTFLIQRCEAGEGNYTNTFHSVAMPV